MLYQKGTQRIEIIVRKDTSGGFGAKEGDSEDISNGDRKGSTFLGRLTGSENKQRQKRVLKTNATHALAVSKQITDLSIEYYISGLGYQNGDQALQGVIQRKVEIVKDVTNVASSVSMGALYGAWGGPIGSALGAVFGAASSLTSIGVKYAGRQRDFNYKIFKENNELEYQRARANINLTNGRLR